MKIPSESTNILIEDIKKSLSQKDNQWIEIIKSKKENNETIVGLALCAWIEIVKGSLILDEQEVCFVKLMTTLSGEEIKRVDHAVRDYVTWECKDWFDVSTEKEAQEDKKKAWAALLCWMGEIQTVSTQTWQGVMNRLRGEAWMWVNNQFEFERQKKIFTDLLTREWRSERSINVHHEDVEAVWKKVFQDQITGKESIQDIEHQVYKIARYEWWKSCQNIINHQAEGSMITMEGVYQQWSVPQTWVIEESIKNDWMDIEVSSWWMGCQQDMIEWSFKQKEHWSYHRVSPEKKAAAIIGMLARGRYALMDVLVKQGVWTELSEEIVERIFKASLLQSHMLEHNPDLKNYIEQLKNIRQSHACYQEWIGLRAKSLSGEIACKNTDAMDAKNKIYEQSSRRL